MTSQRVEKPWLRLSAELYHMQDLMSGSEMKYAAEDMATLEHHRFHGLKESKAMILGTCVHKIMEDDTSDIIIVDVKSRNAKAYKETRALNPDVPILVGNEWDNVEGAAQELQELWAASEWAEMPMLIEPSLVQDDMKARPDMWNPVVSVNWKTTTNVNARAFRAHFFKLGYHLSAGHYAITYEAAGLPRPTFVYPAVEMEPPHTTRMFVLEEHVLDEAIDMVGVLHAEIRQAVASGDWPRDRGQHYI